MTTYAPVPAFADNGRHPRALFLILGAHVAVIAAVMMAKDYVPIRVRVPPTIVELIEAPKPPPDTPRPQPDHRSAIDTPTTVIPIPQPNLTDLDRTPIPLPLPNPGPVLDPSPDSHAAPSSVAQTGPRFVTRESDVKPPYPASKLRDGEEATLRLRLSIDDRGHVTAVEAVGAADPVFLAAARRHLIARWRYQPATTNGHPVATSTVVTLRFELND